MKKIILLLTISFLAVPAMAQHFQVGLRAGVNVSNFTGGNFDAVKKKALVGFHAGGFFRFKISRIALQAEALVSTQGAVIDSVSGSYDWKVTYVNVPLLLQYYLTKRWYLELGPQVGFKLSEDFQNSTLNNFAKDLELSAAAGLGYRTRSGFGLGFRYTAGLSTIGDFRPSGGIDPDFRNGVIQGSLYIPLASSGRR